MTETYRKIKDTSNPCGGLDDSWTEYLLHFPKGVEAGSSVLYLERECDGHDGMITGQTDKLLAEGSIASISESSLKLAWLKAASLPATIEHLFQNVRGVLSDPVRASTKDLATTYDLSSFHKTDLFKPSAIMIEKLSIIDTSEFVVTAVSYESQHENPALSLARLSGLTFTVPGKSEDEVKDICERIREAKGLSPETKVKMLSQDGTILSDEAKILSIFKCEPGGQEVLEPQVKRARLATKEDDA
mmetsp:Transcript_101000/g.184263  ORF Transcript_101000/g.184263 Transcript_101000/m.184263 type:complete len:245 (+) Transcript_101000:59-793(+)